MIVFRGHPRNRGCSLFTPSLSHKERDEWGSEGRTRYVHVLSNFALPLPKKIKLKLFVESLAAQFHGLQKSAEEVEPPSAKSSKSTSIFSIRIFRNIYRLNFRTARVQLGHHKLLREGQSCRSTETGEHRMLSIGISKYFSLLLSSICLTHVWSQMFAKPQQRELHSGYPLHLLHR